MRDLLPAFVLDYLRDRYLAGVADAEAHFDLHRADEDSVSGALGQSMATREPVIFSTPLGSFEAKISYRKIRGRGHGAPERTYGADGLFQVSVTDRVGATVFQKGLPFQSKMNWRGKKKDLYDQAVRMEQHFGGGLIVDFTARGYKACSAEVAIASKGSRPLAEKAAPLRPLGQVLGHDFLDCAIGVRGLMFDPEREFFATPAELASAFHLISTEVRVRQE